MKYMFAISIVLISFLVSSCGGGSGSGNSGGDSEKITRIYNSNDGRSVLFDTEKLTGNVLVSDNDYLFNILQISLDSNWVILEKAPNEAGPGRVETEYLLFYIPEQRLVNIEELNPELSGYGILFEESETGESLVATLKSSMEEIRIPLAGLLNGELPEIQKVDETALPGEVDIVPETTGNEKVILELKLGKGEDQIGQGAVDQQLEGGRFNYAIPSFAARENKLYIIDAINFRILVYDYSGKLIRKIGYPKSLPDRSMIVARDIAIDEKYIYLLSVYENVVYVIDIATEDIATIIDGGETQAGKFGALRSVQTDLNGDILLLDTNDNTLYTYKRDDLAFNLIKMEKYSHAGQLAPFSEETVYSAEALPNGFKIFRSGAVLLGTYICKNPVSKAEVFGTDLSGNIYIKLTEADPMAQFWGPVTIRVVSAQGKQLYSLNVGLWTNGPMERNLVVDREGNLFESTFDGMPDDESFPPTKLVIKRNPAAL